jgi:hypothetical protein
VTGASEYGNESLFSIKCEEFGYLRNYSSLREILFHGIPFLYTFFESHREVWFIIRIVGADINRYF